MRVEVRMREESNRGKGTKKPGHLKKKPKAIV